jgi:hypothetical protein
MTSAAHDRILDVGPKTAAKLAEIIANAGTIVWNGPVGVFELPQFAGGTKMLASAIAHSEAFSIAGGGDTLAAIAKFHIATTSATSRPAAAPSWNSSKARPCRRSPCSKSAPRNNPAKIRPFAMLRSASPLPQKQHPKSKKPGKRRDMSRHTKIVATLGPASSDPQVPRTHGPGRRRRGAHELLPRQGRGPHRARRRHPRGGRAGGRPVGILADLQGPKIRVGKFEDNKHHADRDASPSSSTPSCELGNAQRVGLDYKDLPKDVKPATCCCSTTAASSWPCSACSATRSTPA